MFTELNLAGNRVLEYTMPAELALDLQTLALSEYERHLAVSKLYPNESDVYLFRTPNSLTEPSEGPGYQWMANDVGALTKYKEIILTEIADSFKAEYRISDNWYLLQTNEAWINNDVHQHLTADWVAVAYIALTGGDSIEFFDDAGNSEKYFPSLGTVLVFHATAKHRPNINAADGYRISYNCELNAVPDPVQTEEQKSRMDICNTCDKLSQLKFCSYCNCFMPFKTKFTSATCPINKW
jgi:hypothetical protein